MAVGKLLFLIFIFYYHEAFVLVHTCPYFTECNIISEFCILFELVWLFNIKNYKNWFSVNCMFKFKSVIFFLLAVTFSDNYDLVA